MANLKSEVRANPTAEKKSTAHRKKLNYQYVHRFVLHKLPPLWVIFCRQDRFDTSIYLTI